MENSTQRFTKTVENYVKYRPFYPKEVLNELITKCNLTKSSVIADVGSGTGILTKLFLDYGSTVFAVEPNNAMRTAAETALKNYPNFHSVIGTAEKTTLEDHCVDIITAATAFHWFDPAASKIEFKRILKPKGWVLLVWNVRNISASPLVADYENLLLKFCPTYQNSKAKEFEKTAVTDFFSPCEMYTQSFPNAQIFDWQAFKGRLLSTSYCLTPDDPNHEAMLKALKIIFDKHQKDGKVNFIYETKLYYGHL